MDPIRKQAVACRDELIRLFDIPIRRRTLKSIALEAPDPRTIEEIIESHMQKLVGLVNAPFNR